MDLLSTSQVARELGVSSERVRAFAIDGRLPAVGRTDAGRVFERATVERFRREREARIAGHRRAAEAAGARP